MVVVTVSTILVGLTRVWNSVTVSTNVDFSVFVTRRVDVDGGPPKVLTTVVFVIVTVEVFVWVI